MGYFQTLRGRSDVGMWATAEYKAGFDRVLLGGETVENMRALGRLFVIASMGTKDTRAGAVALVMPRGASERAELVAAYRAGGAEGLAEVEAQCRRAGLKGLPTPSVGRG